MQSRFEFEAVSDAAFEQYHTENPQIYEALRRFALELKRHGRKRLGIAAIFERLRWWSAVETTGDTFKLNHNYRAHYARMLMKHEPELTGFFETRARRKNTRARQ